MSCTNVSCAAARSRAPLSSTAALSRAPRGRAAAISRAAAASWVAARCAFRLPAAVCCVLLAGTLLTGCTSRRASGLPGAEPPRERDLHGLAPPQAASAPACESGAFAAGAKILAGFDYLPERQASQRGDRLLWGIRLEKDGRSRTWYVLIRVLQTGLQPGERVSLKALECQPEFSATPDVDITPGKNLEVTPAGGSSASQAPAQTRDEGTLAAPAPLEVPPGWVGEGPEVLYTLLRIDIYDEHASAMASTHQFLSQNFAYASLYDCCAIVLRRAAAREQPSRSDIQQVTLSMLSFVAVGRLLYATPHVAEIMSEISPQPPLISILLHGGVRVSVDMQCLQATAEDRHWPALADGRRAYRVPFEIEFNDEAALRCRVIAAESHAPLRLCSGILGLEGMNVRKPENRFSVCLLAARLSGETAQAE